jgi:hypothetical protein
MSVAALILRNIKLFLCQIEAHMFSLSDILIICLLVVIIFILVFIGAFLVNLRKRINGLFSDLISILIDAPVQPPVVAPDEERTWDQKFEDYLNRSSKIAKENSGLTEKGLSGMAESDKISAP